MRRLFTSVVLATLLLAAEPPKVPEPYRSLIEVAQAAPPEFAADGILRVVESGKVADQDSRRDLVEQAFQLAASASFHIRMRRLPGSMADTRSAYLGGAYNLKLDRLSLQTRAVRDMLQIDKPKGRELFQEILRPAFTKLTCDDPLVFDVADLYQTLGLIVDQTFTDKERKKEEHLNLLLDYLGQATSPAQLAPLARAIKSVNVAPEQREILWVRLNGLLESMQPDDRSFAAALNEITHEIGAGSQASLEIFRQRSKGCPDDAAPSVTLELSKGAVKAGATPKEEPYWQSTAAKRLLVDGQKLRYGDDGKPYSDAYRASREWQQQLADYLSELADWGSSDEKSEADFFHQKAVVYEALVALTPPGSQRDKILTGYVNFMANSNLQQQSPVEWFTHAHSMLESVRNSNTGEPGKLLDAFQTSGNPVLALFAALEKTFATKLPSWVPTSN